MPVCSVEVDALCSLLRTELSCRETYRTATAAIRKGPESHSLSLRHLYQGHLRFAGELRRLIRAAGGLPAGAGSQRGVWSGVRSRIAAARKRKAGVRAMLSALRQGELYSLALAGGALQDLRGTPAAWVKGRLMEGIVDNLGLLEALEVSAGEAPAR
jgi:hypothetical protein